MLYKIDTVPTYLQTAYVKIQTELPGFPVECGAAFDLDPRSRGWPKLERSASPGPNQADPQPDQIWSLIIAFNSNHIPHTKGSFLLRKNFNCKKGHT